MSTELERLKAENARLAACCIEMPAGLHRHTKALVQMFAKALADKLRAAEIKYGYGDSWATPDAEDWPDPLCYERLMEHLAKGDPRDVAIYCAFLWHHGLSTARCLDGKWNELARLHLQVLELKKALQGFHEEHERSYRKGCQCELCQNAKAASESEPSSLELRDLLAPTIELLQEQLSVGMLPQRRTQFEEELARLRGVVGK